MHIPTASTSEQVVLRFTEALTPTGDYGWSRDKWLYVPDFYCDYRYILGTKGQKPLICIGINPSTAQPDALDNTLASVDRIALHNGFDSFIMFNVYAQRATNPDDMEEDWNSMLHDENMEAFRWVLQHAGASPAIWAAWGNLIEKRPYLFRCLQDMISIGEQFGAVWYTSGKRSIKGHPHHPLYLRKDSALDPFDAAEYCNACISKK